MLQNKRIVVIAGSSGIGAAVARQAHERGARVTITGRNPERLTRAAEAIGSDVHVAAFDASDRVHLDKFFASFGIIDHLASCVGETERGTLMGHDEMRARQIFEMKFWVQLYIVRAARPYMADDGSIVLTGGTSADRAIFPHFSAFSVVGNTALGALVKGLAGEIAPVRINIVEPTLTNTPLLASLTDDEKTQLFERFTAKSPIARVPQPEDVAKSYLHAMESGLINGDRLRPDGGPTYSEW